MMVVVTPCRNDDETGLDILLLCACMQVADFGLSLALDPDSTHISQMHAGTLTHMAPELLLHGRASKASDVYAFGILLWELVTGLRAFQGGL